MECWSIGVMDIGDSSFPLLHHSLYAILHFLLLLTSIWVDTTDLIGNTPIESLLRWKRWKNK